MAVPKQVFTDIHFLKRNRTLYAVEKPYAFRYELDEEHVSQTNLTMEMQNSIPISDIRHLTWKPSVKQNGFSILKLQTLLTYEDFHSEAGLQKYFRAIESNLRAHLEASRVHVFRHGIRKRDPAFPTSTGRKYEYDQPTAVAHVDTTLDEIRREVWRSHDSKTAEQVLRGRVQWINVWKPLKGPLNDWPLTVCDASTVDIQSDLEPADILYPDLVTENLQIYYSKLLKWYYLSDHDPSEIIIFKQADTLVESCPGVPHCSFPNPLARPDESPRESIEARALVYYAD